MKPSLRRRTNDRRRTDRAGRHVHDDPTNIHDLAADRIEALTAKLAQGVERLEKTSTQLDWCIAAQKISKEIDTNLAEIKGE